MQTPVWLMQVSSWMYGSSEDAAVAVPVTGYEPASAGVSLQQPSMPTYSTEDCTADEHVYGAMPPHRVNLGREGVHVRAVLQVAERLDLGHHSAGLVVPGHQEAACHICMQNTAAHPAPLPVVYGVQPAGHAVTTGSK